MTTIAKQILDIPLSLSWSFLVDRKNCKDKGNCLSIGLKLQIGVAIVSVICIGFLFYANNHANKTVEQKVNDLLAIHENLSSNLRTTVFELQKKYLSLPDFFENNPSQKILEQLDTNFDTKEKRTLHGREQYAHLYSRKERRDLSLGKVVIHEEQNSLVVSLGIFDNKNNFSDAIHWITLKSASPAEDKQRLQQAIASIYEEANNPDALKNRLQTLAEVLADEALQAENTRNEILYQVEKITDNQHQLQDIRTQRLRTGFVMSIATLIFNLLVLSVLTRIIIERPLLKLTAIIDEVRAGKFPDIPYADRRDQIGILSDAITNFKEALHDLSKEERRKIKEREIESSKRKKEETIIDELLEYSTIVIHKLESKASELVMLADSQQELASRTKKQSIKVTELSEKTADDTITVLESTKIQGKHVADIHRRIEDQNRIIKDIISDTIDSRSNIDQLSEATVEINGITEIVREIADQTKLLALNATIEAARAGEQGKGFAVVASEVKTLSQDTARATDDIMKKIKAIGNARRAVIANIQQIGQRVEKMNEAGSQIADAVTLQEEATETISQRAIITSDNLIHLTRTFEDVSKTASKTVELSHNVRNHSENIAQDVSRLLRKTKEKLNRLNKAGVH